MATPNPVAIPSTNMALPNPRATSSHTRGPSAIAVHRTPNSIPMAAQVYVTAQVPQLAPAPGRPSLQRGTPYQTTAAFTVQAGASSKYAVVPPSTTMPTIRSATASNAAPVVIMQQPKQFVASHPVPTYNGTMSAIPPSVQRIRGESQALFIDPSGRRSAPPGALQIRPPPRAPSSCSNDSDTERNSAFNALPQVLTYGDAPPAPRISPTHTGTFPVRPNLRKRTTSSTSSGTVRFSPDTFMITMPTAQTLKISNIPRYGTNALMRAIKEKVVTMWLPGLTFQKEGRGEYIVGFAGLGEGGPEPRRYGGYESGLTESDRRNWGIWTARGMEGIVAMRLLTMLFATLAGQGFSYLAELHCLPPQLIFSTTPPDNHSRFFCVELNVTPIARRKQMVSVLNDDGEVIERRKVKLDIARVGIRCIDVPSDVLKAVIGAIRNTGREGAGVHTGTKPGGYDSEGDEIDHDRSELLEFGVQAEKWETKGVYYLDSVISRGTGKRSSGRREVAQAYSRSNGVTQLIEADTDTLPVLLSHVLKALSSHGYRLESSVPLPLPVPLADPFSPFGEGHRPGAFTSFLESCFGGEDGSSGSRSRGHGREAWMFRSVDWFQDKGM
ncbi:hypothetical protein FRC02_001394 [Tulasnella sp. 418]|nr:hypothetical protein FRC02_001394 [Tulasnella sp. 418]